MPSPRRSAAALSYSGADGAPRVVAAGHGQIAERILEAARLAGVPIREDALLAEALSALEVNSEIPPELYEAVATTLVWAYRLDRTHAPR